MRHLLLTALLLAIWFQPPAWADSESGPERTTIVRQDWGTVYHLPFAPETTESEDMLGEYTFFHRGEVTSVQQIGYNDGYLVYFPDRSTLEVKKVDDELHVTMPGVEAYYRKLDNGFLMHLPHDEIRVTKNGNTVKLSGKLGTTVVTDSPDGFTIVSKAGESRYYREDFDSPFKLTGPPVQSHPYVVRGVWLQKGNMGAFINFKLDDLSRAFSILSWYPMIEVDGR